MYIMHTISIYACHSKCPCQLDRSNAPGLAFCFLIFFVYVAVITTQDLCCLPLAKCRYISYVP